MTKKAEKWLAMLRGQEQFGHDMDTSDGSLDGSLNITSQNARTQTQLLQLPHQLLLEGTAGFADAQKIGGGGSCTGDSSTKDLMAS